MKTYIVYVHIVPNGKLYFGITCQTPSKRWGVNGGGYFSKHKKIQSKFYNAIQKYGWDNIQHLILIENVSKDVANECEKYLIAKYNTTDDAFGYNLTKGGDGICGFTYNEETKEQLRKSLTGRQLSDEHKKHISESSKGKPNTWQRGVALSDEVKQKISNSLMGHTVSNETREKIRKANTGRHLSEETRLKQSINNGMHNAEVVAKVKNSLKKSQKERTAKRMKTMKERYPNGITQTAESNQKRSDALKGKPKSEETKQRMRDAWLKRKNLMNG